MNKYEYNTILTRLCNIDVNELLHLLHEFEIDIYSSPLIRSVSYIEIDILYFVSGTTRLSYYVLDVCYRK